MADRLTVASQQPLGAEPGQLPPRTTRRKACLFVVAGLLVTGVLVGAVWAWIAPSIHAVVAVSRKGERVHEYLGSESQNFFVAPALQAGMLGVVAVVAAVAGWQWRAHRGPHMIVALSVGLIGAAAAAAGVGALLVRIRYGALDFDTVTLSAGEHSVTYVTQAPPVFFGLSPLLIAVSLFAPAATASLTYALIATGAIRDDLGGYPPQNRVILPRVLPPVLPPPVPPSS